MAFCHAYASIGTGAHWWPLVPTGGHWWPLVPTGARWVPEALGTGEFPLVGARSTGHWWVPKHPGAKAPLSVGFGLPMMRMSLPINLISLPAVSAR